MEAREGLSPLFDSLAGRHYRPLLVAFPGTGSLVGRCPLGPAWSPILPSPVWKDPPSCLGPHRP